MIQFRIDKQAVRNLPIRIKSFGMIPQNIEMPVWSHFICTRDESHTPILWLESPNQQLEQTQIRIHIESVCNIYSPIESYRYHHLIMNTDDRGNLIQICLEFSDWQLQNDRITIVINHSTWQSCLKLTKSDSFVSYVHISPGGKLCHGHILYILYKYTNRASNKATRLCLIE